MLFTSKRTHACVSSHSSSRNSANVMQIRCIDSYTSLFCAPFTWRKYNRIADPQRDEMTGDDWRWLDQHLLPEPESRASHTWLNSQNTSLADRSHTIPQRQITLSLLALVAKYSCCCCFCPLLLDFNTGGCVVYWKAWTLLFSFLRSLSNRKNCAHDDPRVMFHK